MIIFPAVDIQGGKAVRLRKGRKREATIYADDPMDLAARWKEAGASWLHVIDLDGAFEGACANAPIIGRICRELGLSVQVGGGIRTIEDATAYFEAGAARLIIGTMALEDPEKFQSLCKAFPGAIGVSLDAEKGRLKSRGWALDAGMDIAEALPRLEDAGAAFIIYTDIERDGMRQGPNLQSLQSLLAIARKPVILAGGISTLDDVRELCAIPQMDKLEGLISGRAICDGSLDLREALEWLRRGEYKKYQ